ncbi:hypothetical protein BaRGS_00039310, partial [Batillaria attramentaria]
MGLPQSEPLPDSLDLTGLRGWIYATMTLRQCRHHSAEVSVSRVISRTHQMSDGISCA